MSHYIDSFKEQTIQLLKLYAFILHTTVTLPADIVLQKKVSITEEELLMSFEVGKKALDFLVANSG